MQQFESPLISSLPIKPRPAQRTAGSATLHWQMKPSMIKIVYLPVWINPCVQARESAFPFSQPQAQAYRLAFINIARWVRCSTALAKNRDLHITEQWQLGIFFPQSTAPPGGKTLPRFHSPRRFLHESTFTHQHFRSHIKSPTTGFSIHNQWIFEAGISWSRPHRTNLSCALFSCSPVCWLEVIYWSWNIPC